MSTQVQLYLKRQRHAEFLLEKMRPYCRASPANPNHLWIRLGEKQPPVFFMLWGGATKSKDNTAGKKAEDSLLLLKNLKADLADFEGKEADFRILFCDVHHKIANGRRQNEIISYFESLLPMAERNGLVLCSMAKLIGKEPTVDDYTNYNSKLKAYDILSTPSVLEKAVSAAKKHSRLLSVGATVEEAARLYIEIEVFFLREIDRIFNRLAIFCSFSDPVLQKPIAQVAGVPMLHLKTSLGESTHELDWA